MSVDKKLSKCLKKIKTEYENAIVTGGKPKVDALIKSQRLIRYVHEYVKNSLVAHGVARSKIFPPIGSSGPEIQMIGFLKKKKQDITVLPFSPTRSVVQEGILAGQVDPIGKDLMNQSISINVRSQLSSLGKNFDTLYERTFAEPLNLHSRASNLIMGEVYMVPLVAYDPKKTKQKRVGFSEKLPFRYIPAFAGLNGRASPGNPHRYERLALLIVDFRESTPRVIKSLNPLVKMGLADASTANRFSFSDFSISNFVPDVLAAYKKRHGTLRPLS